MQSQYMSEEAREIFLENFEEERKVSLVGFCVMGGIFSEGIDLTGDQLIGAMLVGTGLPQVCRERELLKDYFDNYHFEEDVRDGDVFFNYKLKTGRATTRNAIRLLELMGYDSGVIERASAQAEYFMTSGVWKA